MCQNIDPIRGAYHEYQDALVQAGLLVRSGVPGVYGWAGSSRGDRALRPLSDADRKPPQRPEVVRFPPLLNRASYEKTDPLETFPNLMGSVHSFLGSDKDHLELSRMKAQRRGLEQGARRNRDDDDAAVCYPLYPTATGTLPVGGRIFDLRGFVFRHEPSADPTRMRRSRCTSTSGRHFERGARASRLLGESCRGDSRAVGLDAKPVVATTRSSAAAVA